MTNVSADFGPKWWSKDTVAVVTGGQKGIGYEIIRGLAKQGMTTVIADFAGAPAMEASKKRLEAELGEQAAAGIFCHPLDVRSQESVDEFAGWLKKEFGGLDILVNNAGITLSPLGYENAKAVIDTNFWGAKRVSEALLPLMRPDGRIIITTSRGGLYKRLKNKDMNDKFKDIEHLTLDMLESIVSKYLKDAKEGKLEEEEWMVQFLEFPMYSESKIFLGAYFKILASTTLSNRHPGSTLLALFCPGLTATDMTKKSLPEDFPMARKTPEEGADTGVWLALLTKEDFPHGKFFAERLEYSYHMDLTM